MTTVGAARRLENPKISDVVTMLETSADSGGERTLLRVDPERRYVPASFSVE